MMKEIEINVMKIYTGLCKFLSEFIREKKFVCYSSTENSCKLEFADNLWPQFLDQRQSDIVVFAITAVQIYKIMVKKWKHVIGPYDIIDFNEELELLSFSIIEPVAMLIIHLNRQE